MDMWWLRDENDGDERLLVMVLLKRRCDATSWWQRKSRKRLRAWQRCPKPCLGGAHRGGSTTGVGMGYNDDRDLGMVLFRSVTRCISRLFKD
ncbi:hypothetical protein SESBI_37240 [Sesbania bispinosa]|nr:hypothetical protein SESBI_37240 [Sesbania bispinosa]